MQQYACLSVFQFLGPKIYWIKNCFEICG